MHILPGDDYFPGGTNNEKGTCISNKRPPQATDQGEARKERQRQRERTQLPNNISANQTITFVHTDVPVKDAQLTRAREKEHAIKGGNTRKCRPRCRAAPPAPKEAKEEMETQKGEGIQVYKVFMAISLEHGGPDQLRTSTQGCQGYNEMVLETLCKAQPQLNGTGLSAFLTHRPSQC